MANIPISDFPAASSANASDVLAGVQDGVTKKFSLAIVLNWLKQQITSLFVPTSREINGKDLSTDITLNASDVGAVSTADVGVADGVASLDSNGKVPSSQLPPISSDAEDITYDPTTSGASATNVQDALDEAFDDLDGKQDTITASGILKGDGAGGVSAAVAGTDYQAPLTAGTDYATPAQLADKANQAQLAYVETGTTASRNYTAGQYISLNGLLHTADTAIASGATFYTSGGNKNLTECAGGGFNNVFKVRNPAVTATAATGVTITDILSNRIGNLIQLVIAVTISSSKAQWNPIVTVDKKPASYGPVTVYTGVYVPTTIAMFINPDNGNIQAGGTINAGSYTIYGFYITNDP